MERPVKWLKLEADMKERAKKENMEYLHLSTVKELASLYSMNNTDLQAFLQFHHTMRDFVYYPELPEVVILQPYEPYRLLYTPDKLYKPYKPSY